MCKRIVIICSICCCFALPVYAHLTGAFADFLAIVYDEQTIEQLQEELDDTRKEIEQLQPVVAQAEVDFRVEQQQSIEQLQFYSEVGLDTWLALLQQGKDVVDIVGSQYVLNQQINAYLKDLNVLYLQFKQLQAQQQLLEGHEDLLKAIEKNLQARQVFLEETAGLELEVIANYLDIDWTAEVEDPIIADLQADTDLVEAELTQWINNEEAPYILPEQWLNDRSNARYYFQSDHIYIEYELQYAHVLVLGQVLQNEEGTGAKLVIEAGFYNGFFLPEELLVELPSFTITYDQIEAKNPYVVQQNGSLAIYSK